MKSFNISHLIYILSAIIVVLFIIGFFYFKSKITNFFHNKIQIIITSLKTLGNYLLVALIHLYNYRLLLFIWYFILFVTVTFLCAKNWNNFNSFNWKEPSKESLLFLWLIVLSIIPFGNCEVFGFKFNSNGNLSPREQIPKEILDNRLAMIESCKQQLKNFENSLGGTNVE
jgi:hypothetical protein